MSTYWVSFRIKAGSGYQQRYDNAVEAIRLKATKWWLEPTSFIVFNSEYSIDQIAAAVKAEINTSTDLVIIGMTEFKSARLIGHNEDPDIYDLIPFIK